MQKNELQDRQGGAAAIWKIESGDAMEKGGVPGKQETPSGRRKRGTICEVARRHEKGGMQRRAGGRPTGWKGDRGVCCGHDHARRRRRATRNWGCWRSREQEGGHQLWGFCRRRVTQCYRELGGELPCWRRLKGTLNT
ncbi:hypothetical protein GOP47_0030954 [Adiantum capillus-veneris]|nr:hypothetical protein GOP47_0030954 [Adiantum capillus-veneris]